MRHHFIPSHSDRNGYYNIEKQLETSQKVIRKNPETNCNTENTYKQATSLLVLQLTADGLYCFVITNFCHDIRSGMLSNAELHFFTDWAPLCSTAGTLLVFLYIYTPFVCTEMDISDPVVSFFCTASLFDRSQS